MQAINRPYKPYKLYNSNKTHLIRFISHSENYDVSNSKTGHDNNDNSGSCQNNEANFWN